jgi:hypothetical protein
MPKTTKEKINTSRAQSAPYSGRQTTMVGHMRSHGMDWVLDCCEVWAYAVAVGHKCSEPPSDACRIVFSSLSRAPAPRLLRAPPRRGQVASLLCLRRGPRRVLGASGCL